MREVVVYVCSYSDSVPASSIIVVIDADSRVQYALFFCLFNNQKTANRVNENSKITQGDQFRILLIKSISGCKTFGALLLLILYPKKFKTAITNNINDEKPGSHFVDDKFLYFFSLLKKLLMFLLGSLGYFLCRFSQNGKNLSLNLSSVALLSVPEKTGSFSSFIFFSITL